MSYTIENASRKAGVEFDVKKQVAVVWHDLHNLCPPQGRVDKMLEDASCGLHATLILLQVSTVIRGERKGLR